MHRSTIASTVVFLFLLWASTVYCQVPVISYTTPNVYQINTSVVSLSPHNTGGSVSSNGEVTMDVFAGSGEDVFADGPGTTATFKSPQQMAMDKNGNIFVADINNYRIRKITPSGLVSTYAGSSHMGDVDGPVSVAQFLAPNGVAVDKHENVYVIDNHFIKKINQSGIVSKLAGSDELGYVDGGVAVARFNGLGSIAVDSHDNLYVTDVFNYLIRKITPQGVVSTLAGNGTLGLQDGQGTAASFLGLKSITIDAKDNIYVTDYGTVRKITLQGYVNTIAGVPSSDGIAVDGAVSTATFGHAVNAVADNSGDIYVADAGFSSNVIRKISNGIVSTLLFKDDSHTYTYFSFPSGMVLNGKGKLFVASSDVSWIEAINLKGYTIDKPLPDGLIFDSATGKISGTPTVSSPPTNYKITATNGSGSSSYTVSIQVTDATLPQVTSAPNIKYTTPNTYTISTPITPLNPTNTGGAVPATIYSQVSTFATGGFNYPGSVTFDAAGNMYVLDSFSIKKVAPDGTISTFYDGINSFTKAVDIAIDDNNNVFILDQVNEAGIIWKISSDGSSISKFAGSAVKGSGNGTGTTAKFDGPFAISIDNADNLYISEWNNNDIRKITKTGVVTTFAGSGNVGLVDGAGLTAKFGFCFDMAIDPSGNLFVLDINNKSIRKVSPTGTVTTVSGPNVDGQSWTVGTIGVDYAGNLYVSKENTRQIFKISPNGVTSVLAGRVNSGYKDDIGAAALFGALSGFAVDGDGNLYVGDVGNNNIRKIILTGYTIDKPLPVGLTFDPTTGTISGKPTQASSLKNYTVTAYNKAGSSSFTFGIQIVIPIAFDPIPQKAVCNTDFDPGATSSLPITYTSSNAAVATIVDNKVHIVGIGTTTITADNGSTTASQVLTVVAAADPVVKLNEAGGISSCVDLDVTFTTTVTNAGTNPTYIWMVNGNVVAGQTGAIFHANTFVDGDKVTVKVINNDCGITSAESDAANMIVRPIQVSTVTIAPSVSLPACQGKDITFTPTPVNYPTLGGLPSYNWYVNNIQVSSDDLFTTSTLNIGDQVYCQMTTHGACVPANPAISNVITITGFASEIGCSLQKPIIPNTFTPNGDGYNDTWQIGALGSLPNISVSVFNRYGTRVFFSRDGYSKPWDGTYNGSAVPPGTYYYIIDPKDGSSKLSGYVLILK